MPHVAPVILPQLLKVIVRPEVYSARTRSRAVHIFNTISSFIYHMSYTYHVSIHGMSLACCKPFLYACLKSWESMGLYSYHTVWGKILKNFIGW